MGATLALAPPRGARAQQPLHTPQPPVETEVEPQDTSEYDAGIASIEGGVVRVHVLVADAAAPVASAGRDVLVSAGELVQRVQDAPEPVQRQWAANPTLVRELLDRLVADRLLAQEALRRGLDRDPYVRAALERALVARLRATVINPAAGDATLVTDDEIREFYEANAYRFHIPERRRARVIFLRTRREAEAVLRLARARRRGHLVNDFRDLARRYNTDPELVRRQGELIDVTPTSTDIDVRLREAIYAIHAPGELARHVVEGDWRGARGYFVVRLTGRRPPIDRTLAESADWIRQRLVLQHRVDAERRLVEQLRERARVVTQPVERVVRVSVDNGALAGDAGR